MPKSLLDNNDDDQIETIVVTSPIKIWGATEELREENDGKLNEVLLKNPLIDIVEICSRHGCILKKDNRYTVYAELVEGILHDTLKYHFLKRREPYVLICSEEKHFLAGHERCKLIGILYWDKAYDQDNNAMIGPARCDWLIEPFEGYFNKWKEITKENILATIACDIHKKFPNIEVQLLPKQIQGSLYEAVADDNPHHVRDDEPNMWSELIMPIFCALAVLIIAFLILNAGS